MDAQQVAELNKYWFESYWEDIHRLADYIVEKRKEGIDFRHKNEYALTILIQDEIVKNDPERVDYDKLAMATWCFLMKGDGIREELDTLHGKGFSSEYDTFEPFNPHYADKYLDQSFELPAGDYIITDPCYIEHEWNYDAIKAGEPEPTRFWETAFSEAMPSVHMRDTLYGDWGCTVFRVSEGTALENMTDEELGNAACGRFCADAGEVCVVSFSDVAKYNPDFARKLEHDIEDNPMNCHYATVIRNFEGTGYFNVVGHTYEYKDENYTEHDVVVALDGVHTSTGEHVRYESRQTSL